MAEAKKKTISLVLGGGGARGYAHIGVIRALEERGLSIRSISGCSMGALVGGIYAMGRLGDFEDWARRINRREIFSLLDFTFGGGGLVRGDRLITSLRELVGEMQIEELPLRFTAVAADLVRGRPVWIDRGPLFEAIRASISLPLFLTPVDHGGVRLVDGGIFDPVPMAPTFRDFNDLTIAVSLSGPAAEEPEAPPPGDEQEEPASLSARLWRRLSARRNDDGEAEARWALSFVVSQSIDAMQNLITRLRLASDPPDVLIEIPRDACGLLEFDRAEPLISLGYDLARASVARL
ncbi:MAG TPA: patatin-like phospholipase family protein [Anaeromyxobacter sp.]|nr:patatin-like phospholipase family protein [Anaeromyxobacter sp.]